MTQPETATDIRRIKTLEDLTAALDSGLIKLYQDVFASPPEYQQWATEDVASMFETYLKYGNIYLAYYLDKIVGLSASVTFSQSKIYKSVAVDKNNQSFQLDEADFWSKLNIDLHSAHYIADLGVEPFFQRRGIGMSLMQTILAAVPSGSPVLLRVSLVRAGAIALYKKLGFQPLELYQIVNYKRTDETIEPARKMFMLKTTLASKPG